MNKWDIINQLQIDSKEEFEGSKLQLYVDIQKLITDKQLKRVSQVKDEDLTQILRVWMYERRITGNVNLDQFRYDFA